MLREDGVDVTYLTGVGVMDLRDHHCRWPIDGEKAGTKFCGARREDAPTPIEKSRPYCAYHNGRALLAR